MLFTGLLSFLSYTLQGHLPRDGTAQSGLGPLHQSPSKNPPNRHFLIELPSSQMILLCTDKKKKKNNNTGF